MFRGGREAMEAAEVVREGSEVWCLGTPRFGGKSADASHAAGIQLDLRNPNVQVVRSGGAAGSDVCAVVSGDKKALNVHASVARQSLHWSGASGRRPPAVHRLPEEQGTVLGAMGLDGQDLHIQNLELTATDIWVLRSDRELLTLGYSLNSNDATGVSLASELRPMGSQIESISCGHSHTLALDVTGRLFAAGNNLHGQLGVGDTNPRPWVVVPLPVQEAAATVSAGASHSLVATTRRTGRLRSQLADVLMLAEFQAA